MESKEIELPLFNVVTKLIGNVFIVKSTAKIRDHLSECSKIGIANNFNNKWNFLISFRPDGV